MRAKKGRRGWRKKEKKTFLTSPFLPVRSHANFNSQQIRSETRFTQVR